MRMIISTFHYLGIIFFCLCGKYGTYVLVQCIVLLILVTPIKIQSVLNNKKIRYFLFTKFHLIPLFWVCIVFLPTLHWTHFVFDNEWKRQGGNEMPDAWPKGA